MVPKIELVDRATRSIRYLEHGWPTELCRWHAHEEYELHLITSTQGRAFVGDYIGDFQAGDLFLTGPNLPHNWVTSKVWTKPVDTRDMLVQFSHSSFEKLAEGFPEFNEVRKMLTLAQSGIQFEKFNPTFARGHMEAIRNNEGPERILAFIRFLVRLNEHAEKKVLSATKLIQISGGNKHQRIAAVVDHIVANFSEEFTVGQAAEMASMSEATFARNFPAMTGHTFIEFLTSVRVGQACGMLYATDDSIADIGHLAGFKNLANFNRHFLKMKGMTPSEYRNTARKDLATTSESAS